MVGRNIHGTLDNDSRQIKGQLITAPRKKARLFLYVVPGSRGLVALGW